jgi:hypothetical protein
MEQSMNKTRVYTQIWCDEGPEAVLEECFRRAAEKSFLNVRHGKLVAFMSVATYGILSSVADNSPVLVGYCGFKNISQEYLRTRKYFVTLWDYRPSVTLIDCVHDHRKHTERPFANAREREMIEAKGADEFAQIDKALRTPFNGVL